MQLTIKKIWICAYTEQLPYNLGRCNEQHATQGFSSIYVHSVTWNTEHLKQYSRGSLICCQNVCARGKGYISQSVERLSGCMVLVF